jgi:hypothetical protein
LSSNQLFPASEAADEREAIEKAAEYFKMPATKLVATPHISNRPTREAVSDLRSLKKGVGIKKTAATLGWDRKTVIRVRNEASA